MYPRPLWTLPVTGYSWMHTPSVTIIGDAAHLTSSFSGMGREPRAIRCLALAGLQKKGTLLGDADTVAAVVAVFEENICRLAGRVADRANGSLAVCVAPDADTLQPMITRLGEKSIVRDCPR